MHTSSFSAGKFSNEQPTVTFLLTMIELDKFIGGLATEPDVFREENVLLAIAYGSTSLTLNIFFCFAPEFIISKPFLSKSEHELSIA
jgi:hypothetical protein